MTTMSTMIDQLTPVSTAVTGLVGPNVDRSVSAKEESFGTSMPSCTSGRSCWVATRSVLGSFNWNRISHEEK